MFLKYFCISNLAVTVNNLSAWGLNRLIVQDLLHRGAVDVPPAENDPYTTF